MQYERFVSLYSNKKCGEKSIQGSTRFSRRRWADSNRSRRKIKRLPFSYRFWFHLIVLCNIISAISLYLQQAANGSISEHFRNNYVATFLNSFLMLFRQMHSAQMTTKNIRISCISKSKRNRPLIHHGNSVYFFWSRWNRITHNRPKIFLSCREHIKSF